MPFKLDRYSEVRPSLYHLTARKNLERIRYLRRLESAAALLRAAASEEKLRIRRSDNMPILVGAEQVVLRDQAPLHEGHIEFTGGWKLEDLVEDLNRRVFFWSGWEHKPIPHGVRHFCRYRSENPVIIRVRFNALSDHNAEQLPFFCKYNSGSPRTVQGRKSPRGPDMFLPAERCPYKSGDVVEITFLESVTLPDDTEVSDHVVGPWMPLFADS